MSEVTTSLTEMQRPENIQLHHLGKLIASVDDRLATMRPEINHLMELQHKFSELPKSMFDAARPTLEQLYDEPTYNDVFVYGYVPQAEVKDGDPTLGGDLSARRGAEFHEGAVYEEGEYTQAILDAADRLGFVKKSVGHASNLLDQQIGIADGDLEPIGAVEAIIVPGAAGAANVMRAHDAFRNILEKKVSTDIIIFPTTERPVNDAERQRAAKIGFPAGTTEFESLILAVSYLTGTEIDSSAHESFDVKYSDHTYEGKLVRAEVNIAGSPINCLFVSAPFDPERIVRWNEAGEPVKAVRANTDETFVAALSFLKPGAGKLLIESHDTWTIGQGIIAEQVFGIAGKDIIATGPRKLDRVVQKTDANGNTFLELSQPEGVVDEIAKAYAFLTQTRIKAENARMSLMQK